MNLENKILKLIAADAKLGNNTIATMLEVDEAVVDATIKKLEADNVILGYKTVIDWEKVGADGVTAMIDVKVSPEREVGFNRVAERICRFPEVRSVNLMSGTYDLSVVVTGETMKDISWFVSHRLSTLEQVQSTTTHFILKRYKQDDFVFEGPQEDKRLVVSP
ncbi:MAG: Lrp/AsnC family transcriptional regulator [Syntrophomonadaceae bacterium]|nr:Lrp/AsnC family transcriptional regulator [Syntrophomonadaceae bacterium]